MLLFVALGRVPIILLVALIGALYLTWVELREQEDLSGRAKLWWFLLVFLTHVAGYLALRVWVALRRRSGARPPAGRA